MDASEKSGVTPGEVLAGKYRVERVIGKGGMGVVMCAHHMQLDERVAIKLLLPEAVNEEALTRFLREARSAVKIKSEHVAHVLDVGQLESGAPYIVMEYLEGGDLSTWLQERGPMKVDQAAEFVLQACEALAEAHGLGIIHRDMKPSNLFWVRRADGLLSIKVLDFGISKLADAAGNPSMTRTAAIVGSPHYMSPEQMQSSRGVDTRTDIWGLGVILFELVSGRVPFDARTITELAILVVGGPPPVPLHQLMPDLPPGFEELVMRCLAKERDDRFVNVAELAIALAPFAPERARGSVDRIQRTLHASGVGAESRISGERPSVVASGGVPRSTMASWGGRRGNGSKPAGRTLVVASGATLTAGLIVAALAFRGRAPTVVVTPGAGAVAPEVPSAVLVPPAVTVVRDNVAGNVVRPSPDAGPSPAASTASPPPPPPVFVRPTGGPPVAVTKPTPPPATSTAKASGNCNPPYFLDADGHRQYKPECL